jgi:hypothetical protein
MKRSGNKKKTCHFSNVPQLECLIFAVGDKVATVTLERERQRNSEKQRKTKAFKV